MLMFICVWMFNIVSVIGVCLFIGFVGNIDNAIIVLVLVLQLLLVIYFMFIIIVYFLLIIMLIMQLFIFIT